MAAPVTIWDEMSTKIDASGDCWEWTASLDRLGYGRATNRGGTRIAHRAVWEALVGPIPDDLEVDHLCQNRACVNPDHLELVAHIVNVRRGSRARRTECMNGHEYTTRNTYRNNGGRGCRTCQRDAVSRYQRRSNR